MLWLSVLPALRAQGYDTPDTRRYHESSIYYLTLQDADGRSVNAAYSQTTRAIGAFVAGELRGTSELWTTNNANGQTIFMVRVWGGENDPNSVTFRMKAGKLEYELGTQPFGQAREETYGSPSAPIAMKMVPVSGMHLSPDNITVLLDGKNRTVPILDPENHTTLFSTITYVYNAGAYTNIFTVDDEGTITGLAKGSGILTVQAKSGDDVLFTASANVSVLGQKVDVTGIRNDMDSDDQSFVEGTDFQLRYTVLPENATIRDVEFQIGDPSIVTPVSEEHGIVTFRGKTPGKTTITFTSLDNPNAKLTYNITITKKPDETVHVEKITVTPTEVSVYVGDAINFSYTVLPENAKDKSVTVSVSDTKILKQDNDSRITAIAAGTATITIQSNDNQDAYATVAVTVSEVPVISVGFASAEATLSKRYDTTLTLKTEGNVVFIPSKVELLFSKAANGEPVATAAMADATGLKWNVRGCYAGVHTAKIRYNGKEQNATCTLNIPAEYVLNKGWDWISLYAVSSAQSNSIPLTKELLASLNVDDFNCLVEVRSQNGFLYNDPKEGFFGNIDKLAPAEGAYKMKTALDDDHAGTFVLSAGYQNLVSSHTLNLPKKSEGYTWVTYPHEINHSMTVLADYLSKTADDGDIILGKTGFAMYDGEIWQASQGFTFEAGKGYIYYTEASDEKAIDWGPASLPSDPQAARSENKTAPSVWNSDPSLYSDCMAVVARIEGIADTGDYSVGAFVGDECRGQGEAAANGLFYIPVSGEKGNRVTFRLYNKATRQFYEPSAVTPLAFTNHVGSHHDPYMLAFETTGITHTGARALAVSLTGNTLRVNGTDSKPVVTVCDVQGKLLLKQRATVVELPRLATGVYVVTVSDGNTQVIKKIKK
jgi:uncharacterized protein YjdB